MNGNYSTNSVSGISELSNMKFNNYNESYNNNRNVLLGPPNYNNPNNTLHNNLNDRIMREQLFDNKILINSLYRDYSKHPEPFSFMVKLNGKEAVIDNVDVEIKGIVYTYPKYISGDTHVVLPQTFKNIKQVYINALIIPSIIEYETQENGSYKTINKQIASVNKYIILKIKELQNYRNYTNNKNIGKESFVMTLDRTSGINNELWIPIYSSLSYFDSRLHNINRLTVEICDDKGNILCTKLDGKNHDFNAEYRKILNDIIHIRKHYKKKEADKMINCLIPKLDSLVQIIECINPEIHLTFVTYEPQIDTNPNFNI
jgi:hypothetical protein